MNLRQLEAFHAIMVTGSVTAAAEMLHVSQPAISAVLKHTEYQLKFKLFERKGGRITPTPEAMALLPDVEEIFGRVKSLSRLAEDMRNGATGSLAIATSPTLANAFLPRAVSLFRAGHPGVTLSIRSLPTPLAVERVARREIELGLVYGPVQDAGVEAEEILVSEVACAVPDSHLLAASEFVNAADLAEQSVISLGPTTRVGMVIEQHCRAVGVHPPLIAIEASSSLAACLMVREGAGLALIERSVQLGGMFPEIVFRSFRPAIPVPICLIYPKGRPRSRASLQMSDELRRIVNNGRLS